MRPHLRRLRPKALPSSSAGPALALRTPPLRVSQAASVFAPPAVHTRTFLGLPSFFQSKKNSGDPDAPPGFLVLKAVHSHIADKIGSLPSVGSTINAIKEFLAYLNGRTASPDQTKYLKTAYIYLRDAQQGRLPLPQELIVAMLRSLGGGLPEHVELARIVFADMSSVNKFMPTMKNVGPYAVALRAAGEVYEVLEICRALSELQVEGRQSGLWEIGMGAAASTGDEKLLLKTLREAVAAPSFPGTKGRIYEIMVAFYCDRGELEKAREWYDRAVDEGNVPPPTTMVTMLKACLREGRMEWGDEMLNTLMTKVITPAGKPDTNKDAWDTALAFTVAQGKGVAGLTERLAEMESFVAANPGACHPVDIQTINTVLRLAASTNDLSVIFFLDEYLTEHPEIAPTLETYDLRIEAALNTPDLPRAVSVFEDMKFNISRIPNQYQAEQIQRLLIALASEPYPSIPRITEIYTDLVQWRVKLNAETVLQILTAHLSSSDFDTIKTFIKAHIGYLTSAERESVISLLIRFSFHTNTPVAAAWEAYRIMAKILPELTVQQRHDYIDYFFEKDNPSLAIKVLTHMSLTPERPPTKETYIKVFLHLARAQTMSDIKAAHRTLNMDPRVEPDTQLLNYLMLAFSRCSLYTRAWFIYDEISRSREGPDHATFSIVWGELCKRDQRDGLRLARSIWDRCKRNKVQLVDRNVASFVEAMSWHHRWEEAFESVKKAEVERDEDGKPWITVGPRTVGTLYETYQSKPLIPQPPSAIYEDDVESSPLKEDPVTSYLSTTHPTLYSRLQTALAMPDPPNITAEPTLEELNPYFEVPDEKVLESRYSGLAREKWRLKTEAEMWMEGVRQFRVIRT